MDREGMNKSRCDEIRRDGSKGIEFIENGWIEKRWIKVLDAVE